MPSISNTLIASLAGFAALSSAAVLPRTAANGYFWTLSTMAQDPLGFSNDIITACNGKFYIGGVDCQKTVVIACGSTTGAQTTCALASEDGLQPIYLASDGSLSYVAPNAGVPSGSNAAVWSTDAQVGYSRTAANSASTFFSQDLVICQTATGGSGQGWQVFSLQGFQGCSGESQHLATLAVPNELIVGNNVVSY